MTLSIFSVADPYIDTFVTSPPASQYLNEVASYLARNVKVSA